MAMRNNDWKIITVIIIMMHCFALDVPAVKLQLPSQYSTIQTATADANNEEIALPKIDVNPDPALMFINSRSLSPVPSYNVKDKLYTNVFDEVLVVLDNNVPVANAGSDRYAGSDPVMLDGTASYDPDNGQLSYQWQQVSGPSLQIDDANTATPAVSGFVQTSAIQFCDFELVVSNGSLVSEPAVVTIIIVPAFGQNVMYQSNPPFDANKPTILAFGGGNCNTGGGMQFGGAWEEGANWISVDSYSRPYNRYANMFIMYLSGIAPDYTQPIQTMGFSTGNMPAIDTAVHLNITYVDPRFAVSRVSLLDAVCRNESANVATFIANPVGLKPYLVDNYVSHDPKYPQARIPIQGALNIYFPGGTHGTPVNWYFLSAYTSSWPNGDMYNGGISGGFYYSALGPGKNLQLAANTGSYYFKWVDSNPDYLEFYNESLYPGRLPEPVTLIGPENGAIVNAGGVVLTCEISENSVGYQLLFGPDQQHVDYIVSDTPTPPTERITSFPFEKTWWTIKVYDQYGSTIYADPICIVPNKITADFTGDLFVNFADFRVLAEEWGKDGDSLRADLVKDNTINELDLAALCQQWLQPCYECSEVDIYSDGKINFRDYCLLAANWLKQGPNLDGDITGDWIVDMADLKILVFHWLKNCE